MIEFWCTKKNFYIEFLNKKAKVYKKINQFLVSCYTGFLTQLGSIQ